MAQAVAVTVQPESLRHSLDTEKINSVVNGKPIISLDVLIVGGGYGGVYALHRFRKLGFKVKAVEAGSFFGGTWHWNRYPGARVDSESPLYSLSIPEVYQSWTWSVRFPDHREIRRYFRHVDDVLGLSRDTYFDTIVVKARWDGDMWTVETLAGPTFRCKYFVSASGSSYKRYTPKFNNITAYKGLLVHSASFPDALDVRGKRVAVVGNGSTGVQIVQDLAKEDCQVTSFIRTPAITFPLKQRKLTIEEQEDQKNFYDHLFKVAKTTPAGFPYNLPLTQSIWDVSEERREALFEYLWSRGGFVFHLSNFRDLVTDEKANALVYDFWRRKVRERIKDPVKADIVAPQKQAVFFGTKRSALEQDYFEMIDRPNVQLVNLKETPILQFHEKGIETTKGLHEFDIVILATGFDALTGSLLDMGLSDRHGIPLSQIWKEGVLTHLGLMIPGLPNFFMSYSPQAPTSLSNGPPIIEYQIDWIVQAITKMQVEGINAVEGTMKAARQWREDLQAANEKTLLPRTNSWWMGANIPGKVREQLIYIQGLDQYIRECDEALKTWGGFELHKG